MDRDIATIERDAGEEYLPIAEISEDNSYVLTLVVLAGVVVAVVVVAVVVVSAVVVPILVVA